MTRGAGGARRITRRALLGLLGGAGLGLAAKGLLDQGREPVASLWQQLAALQRPPEVPVPSSPGRIRVAVGHIPQPTGYSDDFPFDPPEQYPEYPYTDRVSGRPNQAYQLLREALRAWHPEGFGEPGWNPLSASVHQGDTVAIKPNFVWEPGWDASRLKLNTVHPSTLRAVLDYAYRACGSAGRLLVCEGTATAGQWSNVARVARLQELVDHLRLQHGVPVEMVDLNSVSREDALLVQLRERSALVPLAAHTLFDLHDQPVGRPGQPGPGSYYIAPQPLRADIVISLAKMKVHRAAGVTLAMKNIFGLIPSWDGPYGDDRLKDVPHYSDLEAVAGPRGLYLENDTTWRTAVDLNRLLLYADGQGRLQENRQRRYLGIVDGLIAAGRDMFNPEAAALGALVVGTEPVSVDAVASRLMGFDPRRVRSVSWASGTSSPDLGPADPAAIEVLAAGAASLSAISDGSRLVAPDTGSYPWTGYLEAGDFSPPQLLSMGTSGGKLRAVLQDQSGVAYVQLSGEIDGRPFVQQLQRVDGTAASGEWSVALPPGMALRGSLTLEAGDLLFNVQRQTVDW